MDEKKEENTVYAMLLFTLTGLMGVCVTFLPLPANIVIISLLLGISLLLVSVAIAFNYIRVTDKLNKLRENQSGALYIWAVCLLAIVSLSFGWFALTWPAYMIIDLIEGIYTFPPEATAAITLIKTVIGWFLIFMALGLLLWAYVNSQRREEVTFPYG